MKPLPFMDHALALGHSPDLLWALPALSTPSSEVLSREVQPWTGIFAEAVDKNRAARLWAAMTKRPRPRSSTYEREEHYRYRIHPSVGL